MCFNTVKTEQIANLIIYQKWKSLSDDEIDLIKQKIESQGRLGQILRVPKIYFMSFLYEVAFQGSLQAVIQGLYHAAGAYLPFSPTQTLGAILVGTVGATVMDVHKVVSGDPGGRFLTPIRPQQKLIVRFIALACRSADVRLNLRGYYSLGSIDQRTSCFRILSIHRQHFGLFRTLGLVERRINKPAFGHAQSSPYEF